MRTILGFRQEEFIQNGEVKVISKEQNADQSCPAFYDPAVKYKLIYWVVVALSYVNVSFETWAA